MIPGLPPFESRTSFPGRSEWVWHLQLQAERIVSPIRAVAVAALLIWWLTPSSGSAAHAASDIAWLLSAAALYVVIDLMTVYRLPDLVARMPYGSAVVDLAIISAIVYATGGERGPFTDFFFLGGTAAALRLRPVTGLVFSVLYPLAFYLTAPGAGVVGPLSEMLLLVGATLWASKVQEDRVEHLRDPLTGIFTRGYSLFHLERVLRRTTKPFAIGLVDLDRFKQVNDTHGHIAGDEVLQQYVRLISASLRPDDLLARFGGDELIIVWSDLPVQEALVVAERLRRSVEEARIRLRESEDEVRLTVSVGLVEARPGMRPAQLLRQVDQCLYQSKRMRNEVSAC